MESGAAVEARLEPELTTVSLDNLAAHSQADAGARVLFTSMQALKDPENSLEILRVDADAVVADGELLEIARCRGCERHHGRARLEDGR